MWRAARSMQAVALRARSRLDACWRGIPSVSKEFHGFIRQEQGPPALPFRPPPASPSLVTSFPSSRKTKCPFHPTWRTLTPNSWTDRSEPHHLEPTRILAAVQLLPPCQRPSLSPPFPPPRLPPPLAPSLRTLNLELLPRLRARPEVPWLRLLPRLHALPLKMHELFEKPPLTALR